MLKILFFCDIYSQPLIGQTKHQSRSRRTYPAPIQPLASMCYLCCMFTTVLVIRERQSLENCELSQQTIAC